MTQADRLHKDIDFLEWQLNYFQSVGKDTTEIENKIFKLRDYLNNIR